MRSIVLLGLLSLVTLVPIGVGAPVGDSLGKREEVGGDAVRKTIRFRGGERACVLAIGDHDPVVDIQVSVFDEKGNLVAEEKGNGTPVSDFVAVVWYPPRDADYRIEV